MTANLGTLDRAFRLLLGLALIAGPLLNYPAAWGNPTLLYGAVVVGIILVATAMFRFCPLYRVLGVSTCKLS